MHGIAAGNQYNVLLTLICRVKSIENCFGHNRISNDAIMT